MSDKEIVDKLIELDIRMKGLEMMIDCTHDLALKFANFDKRWIDELKKHLQNEK